MGKTKSTKHYRRQRRTKELIGQMDENDVLIQMSEDIKRCWINVSDISNITEGQEQCLKTDVDKFRRWQEGLHQEFIYSGSDITIIQVELFLKVLSSTLYIESSKSDKWKRVEDSTIATAIRICMKLKAKQCYLTKLEQDDAFKFGLVYDEFSRLLYTIRLAFGEAETEIFSDEDLTEKFFNKDLPALMELWGSCSLITADLLVALVIDNWCSTDDHDDLAKSLTVCCTSCVKQVVLSSDLMKHSIPDKCKDNIKKILSSVTDQLVCACESLVKVVKSACSVEEDHPAEDAILNMVTWSLYGLHFITTNVLKPLLAESQGDKDDDLKKYKSSLESLFPLLRQLMKNHKLEAEEEQKNEQKEEVKEEKPDNKKDKDKHSKNKKDKVEHKEPVVDNTKSNSEKDDPFVKLEREYKLFTKEFLGSGKVSICQEDPNGSDVTLFYRPEQYNEIADCTVGPCEMKDRAAWIKDLPLTEDQALVSDIYIVRNGPLKTTTEVEIDFIILPVANSSEQPIKVLINSSGSWNELTNVQQEVTETKTHLSFKISNMDAFIAYIDNPSETFEVDPQGCTYSDPLNGEIKVHFPPECVNSQVKVQIKVVHHDSREVTTYRENCLDSIMGIVSLSDAIEIRAESDVELKKNIVMSVFMDDDHIGEKDTTVVIIRYNDSVIHVLDKSQCRFSKDGNNYKVECRGVWNIAVARIKKIFLNMRDSLKKEFLALSGKVHLCNLVTYIDDTSRDMAKGGAMFWIDFVDKYMLKEDIEMKSQLGFVEVKNSRSKDLSIKQNQTFDLVVEGQVKLTLSSATSQQFKMTYLKGADNHLTIPIEVKRDQEKDPFATFILTEEGCDTPIHTVSIPVRDLSELKSSDLASRPQVRRQENNNSRDEIRQKEEAARYVLAHDSLMVLAKELTERDVRRLAVHLGINEELVDKFRDQVDGDIVRTNFQTLCEWRGKTGRSTMVDFLVSSLRTSGRSDCANVISHVRNRHRGLTKQDFHVR